MAKNERERRRGAGCYRDAGGGSTTFQAGGDAGDELATRRQRSEDKEYALGSRWVSQPTSDPPQASTTKGEVVPFVALSARLP